MQTGVKSFDLANVSRLVGLIGPSTTRRVAIADEDPFPYSDSLHLDFLQQFGSEDVRAILASLPDRYRIPLVLTYMDGFATKEVAGMLNVPLGTVLARLHRGRKLFEKSMWEYLDGVVDATQREAIEEHLAFCRRCCGEVEFAEELRRFLAEHAEDEIPQAVHARLQAALDAIVESR